MIQQPLGGALVLALLMLSACGAESPPAAKTDTAVPASDQPASAPTKVGGIVLRVDDGGQHPDRFCIPQWSIANETGVDIGALLVELEWRKRAGEVLQPAGEFGTLIDAFNAGRRKDLTLNGYTSACSELELVVRKYACRDVNAVRMSCPEPIRTETPGNVSVDLSAAVEGSMRGAVEAP